MKWRQWINFVIWETDYILGCEAAVKVRIGLARFGECGELLLENRFSLRMKDKVYRCCVRSAILYGSEG